jgi:membrane protein
MVLRASEPRSGVVATVVSLATMLLGASGVFGQLQTALNDIFEVRAPGRGGVRGVLRQRLAHFGMILGIGSLLSVSFLLSAALAALHGRLAELLPVLGPTLPLLNMLLSFVIVTAFFALVYKVLPDVRMHWRDVWLGALFTALLFAAGRSLIGIYLARTGTTSIYGAAGSLVLVLLWVYYSAQILLLGAEFTEVYSRFFGSRRTPAG